MSPLLLVLLLRSSNFSILSHKNNINSSIDIDLSSMADKRLVDTSSFLNFSRLAAHKDFTSYLYNPAIFTIVKNATYFPKLYDLPCRKYDPIVYVGEVQKCALAEDSQQETSDCNIKSSKNTKYCLRTGSEDSDVCRQAALKSEWVGVNFEKRCYYDIDLIDDENVAKDFIKKIAKIRPVCEKFPNVCFSD